MIKPLRRFHLQIWVILAVALPAGIFAGWLSVPESGFDRSYHTTSLQQLPLVINTVENDGFLIQIRKSMTGDSMQVECVNKVPVTGATALLFLKSEGNLFNTTESQYLGSLGGSGIYRFKLDSIPEKPEWIVYDFIHKTITDRIRIKI